MGSIWGNEPRYIPHEEHDMTDINMGLTVQAELMITHADGTTDTEIVTLRPVPVEEIVEGE